MVPRYLPTCHDCTLPRTTYWVTVHFRNVLPVRWALGPSFAVPQDAGEAGQQAVPEVPRGRLRGEGGGPAPAVRGAAAEVDAADGGLGGPTVPLLCLGGNASSPAGRPPVVCGKHFATSAGVLKPAKHLEVQAALSLLQNEGWHLSRSTTKECKTFNFFVCLFVRHLDVPCSEPRLMPGQGPAPPPRGEQACLLSFVNERCVRLSLTTHIAPDAGNY